MKTKIFFDTKFTGLQNGTTLISIGEISECGKTFYAELTDFNLLQVDAWVEENVLSKLFFDFTSCIAFEKIGNIYENPELINC